MANHGKKAINNDIYERHAWLLANAMIEHIEYRRQQQKHATGVPIGITAFCHQQGIDRHSLNAAAAIGRDYRNLLS